MVAKPHNILLGELREKGFSMGIRWPMHQRYCSDILEGCVNNAFPGLNGLSCGSGCVKPLEGLINLIKSISRLFG